MNKPEMQQALREGIVRVVFTKKDGTERTMYATLRREEIQRHFSSNRTTQHQGTRNDNVLPVFDVEKDEWRSFRIDSVTEFTPVSLAVS